MAGFRFIKGRWVIEKGLLSELDYGIQLRRWLTDGDGLGASSQAVWTVGGGVEKVGDEVVQDPDRGPIAYVKIKGGGPAGSLGWARCVWTTNQGRVDQRTLHFEMKDR